MYVFESKVRQVGSSLGLLIPRDVVLDDKIKKDETVKVAIIKKDLTLLETAFGSLKGAGAFKREHEDRVI